MTEPRTSREKPLFEYFIEGEAWQVEAVLRNAGFRFVVCPTEFSSLEELEQIRDRNLSAR